jgi:sigma-B regulation protein RsbU (phosphoserine phosphatase)
MRLRLPARIGDWATALRRTLQLAFHDWTREMPKSKRLVAFAGVSFQGYALYALWARSFIWPLIWPKEQILYPCVWLLYLFGYCILNATLTSEFVRKTQLESDVIAARQIQQTLQPANLASFPGYEVETFYKPFREVGGDYFDIIELPENRILLTVADVSGKGMPAALLAANIQALVRSMASLATDPLAFAVQINKHLSRYTPGERFATALFVVLNRDSGEMIYVNAGHNAPIISCSGSTKLLKATGMPLGLFLNAEYKTDATVLARGDAILLFTDGLPDSIAGDDPEQRLRDAMADSSRAMTSNLKSLINPKFNEDDVSILLIKRTAHSFPA